MPCLLFSIMPHPIPTLLPRDVLPHRAGWAAMTPMVLIILLLFQLHTNYLFTHACSTLTGCKTVSFSPFWHSFHPEVPQVGKALLKSQCQDTGQNPSGEKVDLVRSGSLDLWGLLPAQVLHKAPPNNSELRKKRPCATGNPDFFVGKANKTLCLRWCLRLFVCLFFGTSVWNDKFFSHPFLGYILSLFASAFFHERWRFLRRIPAGCNRHHTALEVCCRCRVCAHFLQCMYRHACTPFPTTIPPKGYFSYKVKRKILWRLIYY